MSSPSLRILLCCVLLPAPLLAGTAEVGGLAAARSWRQAHGAEILSDFTQFLALPNVAGEGGGIDRNADYLRHQLEKRGAKVEVWRLPGASPLVFAELVAPGAQRTLGIYAHYDGQPVDERRWRQPPWQPTLYTGAMEEGGEPRPLPRSGEPIDPEWRIYARSAGDDKAPLGALFAALDALQAARIPLTSNLKLMFEGEEEAGSEHLGSYIGDHRQQLQADLWLICDGPVHQSRRPQLVFGVRGYAGIDLTVYGASRYLHSGHYGNWAPNPALLLAQLVAGMKDDQGNVLIEDFYRGTAAITGADRQAIASLPDFDDQLRSELSLAATEAGNAQLAERLLIPSLNIRGLESGAVGKAARNVIPTEATASMDIRLAAGNDPIEMLDRVESHIRGQGYHIVRQEPDRETRLSFPRIVRVERREGYPAVRTPIDLPVTRPLILAAEKAAGEAPILLPTMGGSLPLYLFTEILGNPLVIVPVANHDDNQHAPDENLRVANLWYGIDLLASILTMPPATGIGQGD